MIGSLAMIVLALPVWLAFIVMGLAMAAMGGLLVRTRRRAGLLFAGTGLFIAITAFTSPASLVLLMVGLDAWSSIGFMVLGTLGLIGVHAAPAVALALGVRALGDAGEGAA